MNYDLQKAGIWKRISAWLFDAILVTVLAVGVGLLLSMALGYDRYNATLEQAYGKYEAQYGIQFEISQEEYQALSPEIRDKYDQAVKALNAEENVVLAYNMVVRLSLLITTLAILFAVVIWEFLIPLRLGNGQTLGKKIFGLCLIRNDGVKVNNLQLFTRAVLGKFAIEIMVPVYILMMVFWGSIGLVAPLILLGLLLAQGIILAVTPTNALIHDLLAGTVVVDYGSQTIFRTTEDLIQYQKKVAAERAARQTY